MRALVRSTSAREKLDTLRASGVELAVGDLKSPKSLAAACEGADAVVSTASSTFSRQQGDSIETVDGAGQRNLIEASQKAGIERFVLVSFRRPEGVVFPLGEAKQAAEQAIGGMNYTVLQASYFMEAWLSPALGFDYVNAAARIFGAGTAATSWVSYKDVAEMCAVTVRHPAAERRTIAFGGPEASSMLAVVALFEKLSGRRFTLEHIPAEVLTAQFEGATDSMQKSFAALMLGSMAGDAMEMGSVVEEFGLKLTSVAEYARVVLDT